MASRKARAKRTTKRKSAAMAAKRKRDNPWYGGLVKVMRPDWDRRV